MRVLLQRHTFILLMLILLSGFVGSMWVVNQEKDRLVQLHARHFAEDMTFTIREFRTLYTSEVVNRLKPHGIEITHDYAKKDGAIPLPATLTIELTKRLSQSESLENVRLYSAYPFPWRTSGGANDSFEQEALHALQANPDQAFMRVEERQGKRVLRYATADRMRAACLNCHNTHPDSPKIDWQLGDVRGVLSIDISLDHEQTMIDESMSGTLYAIGILMLAAMLSLILVGFRLRQQAKILETEVKIRTQEVRSLARFPQENPAPVLRISNDNKLIYANPASKAMLQLSGLDIGSLIPAPLLEHCLVAREAQETVEFQMQIDDRWYILNISLALNNSDEINIYGHDITQRKQAEEKLQHLDRVESLGVLAGGIAHDFNNLLTAILGNVSLALKKMDATSPTLRHLKSIENASHSAADLCRQMLAYSGQGQFIIKSVNVSSLVENMGKLIEVSLAKNVVLKFNLSDNIPLIDADVTQIQQVILNLITNASEAIEGKSGVISLSTGIMQVNAEYLNGCICGEQIKPGRYVYLEVSDTGCGMDDATQKKIFDPFFTTKFSGRGLGMSAMLGIVQGHQGALRVYSEVGHGTTIKASFPISLQQINAASEKHQKSTWRASGTVLIIDDEETVREVAALMLEDMGFDVITANDGVEGVQAFRQHQDEVSWVLLDMTMPNMNGEVCFGELRKIQADVQVVLSSGYNKQDATHRFSGKGLTGFIQKPYSAQQMAELLQEVIAL